MIREKLDRFLVSDDWSLLFPHAWVRNFPIYKSDHAPILLSTDKALHGNEGRKRFHFEAMWLSNPERQQVIKAAWGADVGMNISVKVGSSAAALSS